MDTGMQNIPSRMTGHMSALRMQDYYKDKLKVRPKQTSGGPSDELNTTGQVFYNCFP